MGVLSLFFCCRASASAKATVRAESWDAALAAGTLSDELRYEPRGPHVPTHRLPYMQPKAGLLGNAEKVRWQREMRRHGERYRGRSESEWGVWEAPSMRKGIRFPADQADDGRAWREDR